MSKDSDIERFVKNPSLLTELCRNVIEQLDVGYDDLGVKEKEAQLRAISKAIEQLKKTGIAVPEKFREEKNVPCSGPGHQNRSGSGPEPSRR